MRDADRIRKHGRDKYVAPARRRKAERFSIRAGDVVRELGLTGRAPAVCSALKSREFLLQNQLELVESAGPKSGQSTTVIYTYAFSDSAQPPIAERDSWMQLRGAFKTIFQESGGGEGYLRNERNNFYGNNEGQ
jgi:hypothetical protein